MWLICKASIFAYKHDCIKVPSKLHLETLRRVLLFLGNKLTYTFKGTGVEKGVVHLVAAVAKINIGDHTWNLLCSF